MSQVTLDDPVSKFLPAFADLRVILPGSTPETPLTEPARSPVTMRHLLTHTSGLSYGIFSNSVTDTLLKTRIGPEATQTWFRTLSNSELCAHIAAVPLSFHPGTAFLYSLGLDVIGHVIEIISGTTLDDFMQTRVFEPLGMHDTFFTVPPAHAHRLVPCYEVSPSGGVQLSASPERDRSTSVPLLAGTMLCDRCVTKVCR
jgi:CubicO group peptidase (beta-lactamase class C family)